MPSWPIRELIVQSDVVVLATPIGPAASGRFKVTRVIMGTVLKEGQDFDIDGLSSYNLTVPVAEGSSARKPAGVTEALLFLASKKAEAPRFPLTPSGMRIL